MSHPSFAAAIAAALLLSSSPVSAHDGPLADDHAPAGVMTDHVHRRGDVMVGLRLTRDRFSGDVLRGTRSITDLDVANAGYSSVVQSMTMDMAMLDLMWAPTDRLTLMVMPQYMRMKMVMRGLPTTAANSGAGHGHGGHAMAPGAVMSHSHDGFGDTVVAGLLSLHRSEESSLHADFAVSVPTGSVSAKDAAGSYLHYGMQVGSGTWDLIPGLTWSTRSGTIGWGAQLRYIFRTAETNDSGFRFGDRLESTGWVSWRVSEPVSLSLRALYFDEGNIEGHYNGPHHHSAPVDRQANYGGERLEVGVGANLVATGGPLKGVRLGLEALLPVHQDVNGIQTEKRSSLQFNLSKAF